VGIAEGKTEKGKREEGKEERGGEKEEFIDLWELSWD
jgi:hypothetical protein